MKDEISSLGNKIFVINFREARIHSKNGTQFGISEEQDWESVCSSSYVNSTEEKINNVFLFFVKEQGKSL